jgi:hypothetical protein
MRRREFITLLGGAAAVWPLAARAQQRERMRRIGVLIGTAADDPQAPPRIAALAQGLQELGWIADRNVRIDYRWPGGDAERIANKRRNWPRSRRTSSWRLAPTSSGRCCRQPAQCRSCSRSSVIRSAPYYAVPPMEPSQSNGVSPNSGDAARRGAVGGKRADHTDRDSAMSAVLAHLVGW